MLILPRSLVDEAKSKIWSINQIQFSFSLYYSGGVTRVLSSVRAVVSAIHSSQNLFLVVSPFA